jgi:hypothetical protein
MRKIKLGDMIAAVAKLLHIPHCRNCEERRRILNEIGNGDPWSVREIRKKLKDCCKE